ncbi:MAG: DUF378 domain-containing protein [Phycisphaerae bacterium]
MKTLDITTIVLVIIGALNWGLIGVAHVNLVMVLFGDTVVSSLIYALVGLSGLYLAIRLLARPEPFLPHMTHHA